MIRKSFRFLCDASKKEINTNNTVSLHASPLETPFLLEAEREKKPFIDPTSLRAFIASFLVGSFGIASMYWLMSHRVSTEAMHRRRFIQSMTGTKDEDYDKDSGRLIRRRGVGLLFGDGKDQPFEQFVSPSCQSYRELVEQVEEAERIIALENEVNNNNNKNGSSNIDEKKNNSSGQRITISLPKKPSSMFSEAIHASTLHETAMDHLKQTWNDSIENVQDALRSMMSAWVDMRERDTIAAVNEMARSALGEEAVVVRRT